MTYRISRHARQEMVNRGLTEADLDAVLQNPDQIVDADQGRKVYQSRRDFYGTIFLVRVVVVDSVDPAVIVTVYLTTRIAKYWRTTP